MVCTMPDDARCASRHSRSQVCFEATSYPATSVPALIRANVKEQPDSYYCCDNWCPYQNQAVSYTSLYPPGTMSSRTARCFYIDVIKPVPVFDPPNDLANGGGFLNPGHGSFLNFRAGCTESVFFAVRDTSVDAYAAAEGTRPYEVEVKFVGGNMPPGMSLRQASECPAGAGPRTSCFELRWTPTVADAQGGFEACFAAVDVAGVTSGNPLQRRCYGIRVKKCQYCVSKGENGQPGDTFASIGAGFGLDWLLLYMANPTIRDPTNLAHGSVINLGVVYKVWMRQTIMPHAERMRLERFFAVARARDTLGLSLFRVLTAVLQVRPGDYLELLAEKFFTTVDAIKRLNSDISDGLVLQPGMEVCVMPPVCDVKCLYGTDCHIY